MTPGAALTAWREAQPLVHCITNYVAMNFAANVLNAAGAAPAMIHAREEAGEFARLAGAVTINVGTISPHWLDGMIAAAEGAIAEQTPWVLDPVAHYATRWRRAAVDRLMTLKPAIVRGNASEILALAGEDPAGRGVDSGDSVEAAADAAARVAQATGGVVVVSGAVDLVTDGTRGARVAGGSALMPRVTAMGCAQTALIGAAAAAVPDRFEAALAATAAFAAAGQAAEANAAGPGTFAPAFLDALWALTPQALDAPELVRAA